MSEKLVEGELYVLGMENVDPNQYVGMAHVFWPAYGGYSFRREHGRLTFIKEHFVADSASVDFIDHLVDHLLGEDCSLPPNLELPEELQKPFLLNGKTPYQFCELPELSKVALLDELREEFRDNIPTPLVRHLFTSYWNNIC